MKTILRYTLLSALFVSVSLTLNAQNSFPFNQDRGIRLNNPYANEDQVTIYIKAQSLSKAMNSGHGSYSRLFGASSYFLELADVKGELALYNGRAWYPLGVDIRKVKKDIFVFFDKGMVRVIVDNKIVTEKKHPEDAFNCVSLLIGSSYHYDERFQGEVDYFGVYKRILNSDEMAEIINRPTTIIENTKPTILYDFNKGLHYKNNNNPTTKPMQFNIGIRSKEPIIDTGELSIDEEVYESKPEVLNEKFKQLDSGTKFQIEFSDIIPNIGLFVGQIKDKPLSLEPGAYEMVIGQDGKVTIKIKTEVDKN